MELRDLRYFEALASELNFGRAANALHLTQPALSLAVARLERQVGCALFQRTPGALAAIDQWVDTALGSGGLDPQAPAQLADLVDALLGVTLRPS